MSAKEEGDDEKLKKQIGLPSMPMAEMENQLGFSDRVFVEPIIGSGCKTVAERRKKLLDNVTLKLSDNVLGLLLKCMQDYQSDSCSSIHCQGRAMHAKEGGEDGDLQKLQQLGLISALLIEMENQLCFSDRVFVESIIGSGCKTVAELHENPSDYATLKLSDNVLGLLLKCMQDYQQDSRSSIHCQGRAMSAKEEGDDEKLKKQIGLPSMPMAEMENQLGFSDRVFVEPIIGSGCKTVAERRKKLLDNVTLKLSDNVLGLLLKCMQDYQSDSRSTIHCQGRAMHAKEGGEDGDLQKLQQLGLISALLIEMENQLCFSDRVFVESIIGSGCKTVAELHKKPSDYATLKLSDNVMGMLLKCVQDYQSDSPSMSREPRLFGVYRGKVVRVLHDSCKVKLVDFPRMKGWVYTNEMARRKIQNAWEVVEPGQEIFVKIISTLGGRLVLSMRDIEQEHGRDLLPLDRERYLKDQATAFAIVSGQPELFRVYKGKVGRVTENYCFVHLFDFRGMEGLLRKSEMARCKVDDAREIVRPGQFVFVKVIMKLGKKLIFSIRDVDQKSGKDWLPLTRRVVSQPAITEGAPKTAMEHCLRNKADAEENDQHCELAGGSVHLERNLGSEDTGRK